VAASEGAGPGMARVASAYDRGAQPCFSRIKVWLVGLLLVLSSVLSMPRAATAVVSAGKSHISRTAEPHKSTAGKKLVIAGAGISTTLQQVFDSLDTHKTGAISKGSLKTALVELKTRGFMTHGLSESELDAWLDGLVEKKTKALKTAAAAGDPQAAAAAASLGCQMLLLLLLLPLYLWVAVVYMNIEEEMRW